MTTKTYVGDTGTVITLDGARSVIAGAKAYAKKNNAPGGVIAVVDDGGHLILLERLDDTQVASVEVGIGKARTAAIFRRPSKVFEDQIRDGRVAALALPGATPPSGPRNRAGTRPSPPRSTSVSGPGQKRAARCAA